MNSNRRAKAIILSLSGLIFLMFASAGHLAAQENQPEQKKRALLNVKSNPSGLAVYLDGKRIGYTPIREYGIKPGQHTLVVYKSRQPSWFSGDWQKTLQAAPGDTLQIDAHFKRSYLIHTQPYGAKAYLNGQYLGTTPLEIELADSAKARVALKKNGFQTAYVNCTPTGNSFIKIVLQANDKFLATQKVLSQNALQQKSRQRRFAMISGTISLAAGVAAILLKKKADHLFGEYQHTANPAEMDHFFTKTRQYDKYSSLAFGIFQISFGLGFYYFLKSNQP